MTLLNTNVIIYQALHAFDIYILYRNQTFLSHLMSQIIWREKY